jgi:hypothetical protein
MQQNAPELVLDAMVKKKIPATIDSRFQSNAYRLLNWRF